MIDECIEIIRGALGAPEARLFVAGLDPADQHDRAVPGKFHGCCTTDARGRAGGDVRLAFYRATSRNCIRHVTVL